MTSIFLSKDKYDFLWYNFIINDGRVRFNLALCHDKDISSKKTLDSEKQHSKYRKVHDRYLEKKVKDNSFIAIIYDFFDLVFETRLIFFCHWSEKLSQLSTDTRINVWKKEYVEVLLWFGQPWL